MSINDYNTLLKIVCDGLGTDQRTAQKALDGFLADVWYEGASSGYDSEAFGAATSNPYESKD